MVRSVASFVALLLLIDSNSVVSTSKIHLDGPKRQGTQSDPPSSVTFLAAQSHLAHQIDLASNASSILLALQKLSTSLAVSESIALGAAKSESFLAKARELLSLKELAEAIKADEDERGADAGLGGAEKGKEGEEGGRVASMVTTTRLELAKHVDEMAVLIRQQAIAAELFVRKTSTEKRLGREKSIRLAKEEASQQDEKVEGAREGLANVVRCGKRSSCMQIPFSAVPVDVPTKQLL